MNKPEHYKAIINKFLEFNPNASLELDYYTDFQLLIAVILSAQCTDKRVNLVTKKLFVALPNAVSMSHVTIETIYSYIDSISYPHNKAKYLLSTSKLLVEKFDSQIPCDIGLLQTLPGVGRKTAHVLGYNLYSLPVLAVDTHVFRVSKRLGLVDKTCATPLAVEKQMMQYLPKEYIGRMSHWLILHGRYICRAKIPKCDVCFVRDYCQTHCQSTLS